MTEHSSFHTGCLGGGCRFLLQSTSSAIHLLISLHGTPPQCLGRFSVGFFLRCHNWWPCAACREDIEDGSGALVVRSHPATAGRFPAGRSSRGVLAEHPADAVGLPSWDHSCRLDHRSALNERRTNRADAPNSLTNGQACVPANGPVLESPIDLFLVKHFVQVGVGIERAGLLALSAKP